MLRDDQLVCWYIDHDITTSSQHPGEDHNKEPLLVNTVNSWHLRPQAYTYIPNLFLASDYVQTFTDLATMEGANEAARRAVNAIIEKSGAKAALCEIWNLHEPGILAAMRNRDQKRYNQGLSYQFHIPEVARLLLKIAGLLKSLLKYVFMALPMQLSLFIKRLFGGK